MIDGVFLSDLLPQSLSRLIRVSVPPFPSPGAFCVSFIHRLIYLFSFLERKSISFLFFKLSLSPLTSIPTDSV